MQIQYSKQALKFLKRQDLATRVRIVNAIHMLPAGDVKKLRNQTAYRLRIGDYRILFEKEGHTLFIEKIDTRGHFYK